MKEKVNRIIVVSKCWWFGHEPVFDYSEIDHDEHGYYQHVPCDRCGLWDIDQHGLYAGSKSFKVKQFFVFWFYRRWWPEACKDCGKRFGGHCGCVPF